MKDTGYELFISMVALLSIGNMVFIAFAVDPEVSGVMYLMNAGYSLILFGDFCYRMWTAQSRSGYFLRGFGWADLLSCLPFPQVKPFRLFRLVRVYRLLRVLGARRLARALVDDLAGSALLTLLLVALLVLEFGSLAMLQLEASAPGATITSGSDALWYTLVTMATVGYGDEYPVTSLGRLLGSVVIVVGVGVFGTLTGYLANTFVRAKDEETDEEPEPRLEQLRALRQQQAEALSQIDRLIGEEERRTDGAG